MRTYTGLIWTWIGNVIAVRTATAIPGRGQSFACPRSRIDRGRDHFADADWPRLRTVFGRFVADVVACSRTIKSVDCARTWIVRGRVSWRGLIMDAHCSWTRKVPGRVLCAAESSSWTGRCRVHEQLLLRGYSACSPRRIRGHQVLRWRRGSACPVLNMMRNTLPPLLQQLVAPVCQLRGDGFNPAHLLDGLDFNAACMVNAVLRFGQLHYGILGLFIQPFTELFEHFDGGVDLGSGWCLHNQIRIPQAGWRTSLCRCPGRRLESHCARLNSESETGCAHGSPKPSCAAFSSAMSLLGASTVVRNGSPNSRAYSRSVW